MKKLSLKYLFERIQKIENEYQKKPKIHDVILHKEKESEAIKDLKEKDWKEVANFRPTFSNPFPNECVKLEKKVY